MASAFSAMLSRSPTSSRASRAGEYGRLASGSARSAACEGFCGTPSRIASSHSASVWRLSRYGLLPVSSSYSTTPSEYTSVMVVTGSPRICSGAA